MAWINTVNEVQIPVKGIFNGRNIMTLLYNKDHRNVRLNSEKLCWNIGIVVQISNPFPQLRKNYKREKEINLNNQRSSDVFRGNRNKTLSSNGLECVKIIHCFIAKYK